MSLHTTSAEHLAQSARKPATAEHGADWLKVHLWIDYDCSPARVQSGKPRNGPFTSFDYSTTPPTLIRHDYALTELREHGATLPKLYCDELGNIRNEKDEIVMAGPPRVTP